MKRRILSLMFTAVFMLSACHVSLPNAVPKNWYSGTLDYYREGFETGWKNEDPKFNVPYDMKDPANKFGYLLTDLNGDGADELLVGIIDDSEETRFLDVVIWHSDIGAFRIFSAGDGYYIYLCDENVLRMDSWYGSETKTDYMVYNPEGDTFINVDDGSKPRAVELTPFIED